MTLQMQFSAVLVMVHDFAGFDLMTICPSTTSQLEQTKTLRTQLSSVLSCQTEDGHSLDGMYCCCRPCAPSAKSANSHTLTWRQRLDLEITTLRRTMSLLHEARELIEHWLLHELRLLWQQLTIALLLRRHHHKPVTNGTAV